MTTYTVAANASNAAHVAAKRKSNAEHVAAKHKSNAENVADRQAGGDLSTRVNKSRKDLKDRVNKSDEDQGNRVRYGADAMRGKGYATTGRPQSINAGASRPATQSGTPKSGKILNRSIEV